MIGEESLLCLHNRSKEECQGVAAQPQPSKRDSPPLQAAKEKIQKCLFSSYITKYSDLPSPGPEAGTKSQVTAGASVGPELRAQTQTQTQTQYFASLQKRALPKKGRQSPPPRGSVAEMSEETSATFRTAEPQLAPERPLHKKGGACLVLDMDPISNPL